jgi:hypothetical protein
MSLKTKLCKTKLRCILVISLILILGAGTYAGSLFLFPVKPKISSKTGLSCSQIGECNKSCVKQCPSGFKKMPCMLSCNSRCRTKGCDSAKKPDGDLVSCMKSKCLMKCMGGPGPKCESCKSQKCPAQSKTCKEHKCN